MSYTLTDSQAQFREKVREFVNEWVIPTAHSRDKEDVYPSEIIKKMSSRGYPALTVPGEYGGLDGTKLDACVLLEEVAYGCAATAVSLVTIFQAETMLLLFGNENLKRKYLPMFRTGLIASYALTELKRGSDIRQLETKAVRKGSKWVLNGRKTFITSASAAGFFVILAETDRGVSAFAVERDTPGLRVEMGEMSETFGLRNGPHLDISFVDVIIPDYHLIGQEGYGLKQALITLNNSRTIAASVSIGIARAAYENSLRWVQQRSAFDKKVFDFQGVQWMFADMLTNINAARLLTHHAASLLDKGYPAISEASQAKLFSAQMATKVCADAIQVCGAYGVAINAPFGRYLRDAKAYEIAGGSNEILRNTIASEIRKEGQFVP
jgi:alkylation response protein AidB-like acyl-CoA dehydrogenase